MATSADGVQVNLPKQQKGKKNATKAPATLNQFEINPAAQDDYTAADEAPGCGWSNTGMWGLFAVGWIFLPCWWIGVVAGLRSGQDGEFLVKRRKKLTTQQTYAWWGCVIMSFVSAIILILALSIALGRKAPEAEGPFFLTIAGPNGAFPDLNDPAKMLAVRQAVKGALNLPSAYAVENIRVWIEDRQEVTPAPSRRLLDNDKVVMLVLGYSLVKADDLPPFAELKTAMEAETITQQFAEKLADVGFVTPEQLGQLSVVVTTINKIAQVLDIIQGKTNGDALIVLVPIGASTAGCPDGKTGTGCNNCKSGYGGTTCQKCAAGTYSAGGPKATTICQPCINGVTTSTDGATSKDQCTVCDAGWWSSTGDAEVLVAPTRRLQSASPTSAIPRCRQCSRATTTAGPGTASNSTDRRVVCKVCATGYFSADGTSDAEGGCQACAYEIVEGGDTIIYGTTTMGPGTAGNRTGVCTVCMPGYYSVDGLPGADGNCTQCPPGKTTRGPQTAGMDDSVCVEFDACMVAPCVGEEVTCEDLTGPNGDLDYEEEGRECTCTAPGKVYNEGQGCVEIDACNDNACNAAGGSVQCEDVEGGDDDESGRTCTCTEGWTYSEEEGCVASTPGGCEAVTNIAHSSGTFNCAESPFDAECTAVCDEGFVPSDAGPPKTTCGAQGWGEPVGACVAGPEPTPCAQASPPEHPSHITVECGEGTGSCTASCRADQGYSGTASVACYDNNVFVLTENCTAAEQSCTGNPANPANGTFSCTGASAVRGATCFATCDNEFTGNPTPNATCSDTATWGSVSGACVSIADGCPGQKTGDDCKQCNPGYGGDGIEGHDCHICNTGTHSNDTNLPVTQNCLLCPLGYTTAGDGATSADNCTLCATGFNGTNCELCKPGFGKTMVGETELACYRCPTGTYSPGGAAETTECLPCGPGLITTSDGSVSCKDYLACAEHPCLGDANAVNCTEIVGGAKNATGRTCECLDEGLTYHDVEGCVDMNACAPVDPCLSITNATTCTSVPGEPGAPPTFTCGCDDGYLWNAGACQAGCSLAPPAADGATWDTCVDTPSGASCNATCDPATHVDGEQGAPTATCMEGDWDTTGSCVPKDCPLKPETDPSGGAWDECVDTPSGGTCNATCTAATHEAGVSGPPTITCTSGAWGDVTGSCVPKDCPLKPETDPSGGAWDECVDTPSGGTCNATCTAATHEADASGPPTTTCTSGQWGTATGSCVVNDTTCINNPSHTPADSSWPSTCRMQPEGYLCTADCTGSYEADPVMGKPKATCTSGAYVITGAGACVAPAGR